MTVLGRQVGGNHYQRLNPQPIVLAYKWKLNFAVGCILKYLARYKFKDGIKDLHKAIQFIEFERELNPINHDNHIIVPIFPAKWTLDIQDWELTSNIVNALAFVDIRDYSRAITYIEYEITCLQTTEGDT